MYEIVVADDHEVVRSGIKCCLETQKFFCVAGEASSFGALMDLLLQRSYDLLILDLNLGDKNGINAVREINDYFNELPILVLSIFPEDPYALQCINAGAMGYLNKKMALKELVNAIDHIIKGKIYLNQAYLETLPFGTKLCKVERNPINFLSKRESEVYALITTGNTAKEIAEKLSLSPKTISTYRTRILEKLSLSNTNQLIHFALQDSLGGGLNS